MRTKGRFFSKRIYFIILFAVCFIKKDHDVNFWNTEPDTRHRYYSFSGSRSQGSMVRICMVTAQSILPA